MPINSAKALKHLKDSIKNRELVAVIGTGVSMALTAGKTPELSWTGLIRHGLAHGESLGKISAKQRARNEECLDSDDIDDLLSAAEFLGGKLDAPGGDLYACWLKSVFKEVDPLNNPMAESIRALVSQGVPLATLNYDPLLEKVTGRPALTLHDKPRLAEWVRQENPGILHLHGYWEQPETCVLGIRDYAKTVGDKFRNLVQQQLGGFKRLLFIGCGDTFADPNFSHLIGWLRPNLGAIMPEHYALVREGEIAARTQDECWHGFVEPMSFGADHADLPAFLLQHFPPLSSKPRTRRSKPATTTHDAQLETYRAFLIKDCGSMAVEGMKASVDVTQQRFDIEKLFVPLEVFPTPPDFTDNDPQQDEKLRSWEKKNRKPQSFSHCFAKHRHLALLALPGGGKTMLLKRLAVAYTDPTRRTRAQDDLPEQDLYPVLIRCREWRPHIHLPIMTLLRKLDEPTGESNLKDFDTALTPLLKTGKVLLLVDGLDEIHDDGERQIFVKHLAAFLTDYPKIRLVTTSREAGFAAVAPTIAGFCAKWRVAPLSDDSIKLLCRHWHELMSGGAVEAAKEADATAGRLINTPALRRLAENPLLATMLLVVKQGGGGLLPADRVTLYSRAVEVLLDTWNVAGHPQLSLREAIPQLAFVAYEMMRQGKQTATRDELLTLLERARTEVFNLGLYAKDPPDVFLQRVERRSSLLVEAGHKTDNGILVPFYQFRHLTFQEYLAAVAVVRGYTPAYQSGDTILKPLADYLTAEEWKEVVPMAAALAGNNAEPLLAELVRQGNVLRRALEAGEDFIDEKGKRIYLAIGATPIARLSQCLIEEAQPAPPTLTAALELVLLFAGISTTRQGNWRTLFASPYAGECWRLGWRLYKPMDWPKKARLTTTLAAVVAAQSQIDKPYSHDGQARLIQWLQGDAIEDAIRALLTIYARRAFYGRGLLGKISHELIEPWLFSNEPAAIDAALAAWGYAKGQINFIPKPEILDRLLHCWFNIPVVDTSASYSFSKCLGLPRHMWKPVLTKLQIAHLRNKARDQNPVIQECLFVIAFHTCTVWPDAELAEIIFNAGRRRHFTRIRPYQEALNQLGDAGKKYADKLREITQPNTDTG